MTTTARVEVSAPPVAPRARRRRGLLGLLAAPTGFLALFFLVPVLMVAAYSVGLLTLLPHDLYLSLQPWRDFFASETHVGLFWKSVRLSVVVSAVSVLLAYPIAYALALVAGRRKYTLLLVILAPFLTSYLLRVLAWRVILGDEGLIITLLRDVGVLGPEGQISWLFYSPFAVYVVLAYVWVPFVALPIFVTLDGMDRDLLEASHDLGATRWTTFLRVTLPLSVPGVVAAFVFVFIPTIGEYVTPLLVGGPKGFFFGNAIQGAILQGFDWQFGAAMAMFLVGTVTVLLVLFGRYLNVRAVAE